MVIAAERRVAVGDVERGVVGGDDVVVGERPDQLVADLTARAGDEDPHVVLASVAGLERLPPPRVVAVPRDGGFERLGELALRPPAERLAPSSVSIE